MQPGRDGWSEELNALAKETDRVADHVSDEVVRARLHAIAAEVRQLSRQMGSGGGDWPPAFSGMEPTRACCLPA